MIKQVPASKGCFDLGPCSICISRVILSVSDAHNSFHHTAATLAWFLPALSHPKDIFSNELGHLCKTSYRAAMSAHLCHQNHICAVQELMESLFAVRVPEGETSRPRIKEHCAA